MAPSKRSAAMVAAALLAPAAYTQAQNIQTSTYTAGSFNTVKGPGNKPHAIAYPGYLSQKGDGSYQFLINSQVIKGDNNSGQTNVGIQTTGDKPKPGPEPPKSRKLLGGPGPPKVPPPQPLQPGYIVSVNGQSGDGGKGGNIWQFQSADSYATPGNKFTTSNAVQTNTNSGNGGASGAGVDVDASTKGSYNQNGRKLQGADKPAPKPAPVPGQAVFSGSFNSAPLTINGGDGGDGGLTSVKAVQSEIVKGPTTNIKSPNAGVSANVKDNSNGGDGAIGAVVYGAPWAPGPPAGHPGARKLLQQVAAVNSKVEAPAGYAIPAVLYGKGGDGGDGGDIKSFVSGGQAGFGYGVGPLKGSVNSNIEGANGGNGAPGVVADINGPAPKRSLLQAPPIPGYLFGSGGPGGAGGSSTQFSFSPQYVTGSGNYGISNQAGQDTSNSNNGGFGGNGATVQGGAAWGRKLSQLQGLLGGASGGAGGAGAVGGGPAQGGFAPPQYTFGAGGPGGNGGSSAQSNYSPQFVVGSGNSHISNSVGQDISASGNGGFGGNGVTQPQAQGYGRKLQSYGNPQGPPPQFTFGAGGSGGSAGSSAQASYSPQFLVGAGNQGIFNQAGQSLSASGNGGWGGSGVTQPQAQGSGRKLQQLFGAQGSAQAQPAAPQYTFGAGGPGGNGGSSGQANFSPQFVVGAGNQGIFNQAGQSTSDSNNGGFGGAGAQTSGGSAWGRKLSQWGQTTAGFGGSGGFGGSSSQSNYSPQFLVGSGNGYISNSVGQDTSNSNNGGFGGNGVTQFQPRQ